ncbi:hypothetical protein REPUB_Repub10bG0096000 [Reevesia pubescens]
MVGIGGVLHDSNGVVKLVFSKNIGVANSNVVELLVMKEAFLIFVASSWCNVYGLIIESDNQNIVKRSTSPSYVP